jgi:hypothetical protein
MQYPSITNLAFIVLIAIVVIYIVAFDTWAWMHIGRHATFSAHFCKLAHDWPIIPFLVGMLIGHLFW